MDQRERNPDLVEAIRSAITGWAKEAWTCLPAYVDSWKASNSTVSVQPTIQVKVLNADGSSSWVKLPLIPDVPVVIPSSGGFALTFPIVQGDECLLVFANRCIDNWWANGGVQTQAEFRLWNLSDGFAIFGPRSVPRVLANISANGVQLRNTAGTAYFQIDSSGGATIVAPNGVTITGVVNITGNVHITGNLVATGEGTFGASAIPVTTHLHTGVSSGASNTGTPIA